MAAFAFHCRGTLKLAVLLLLVPWPARGQAAHAPEEEVGDIVARRERVPWPAPESLVAQLRSGDSQMRLKALLLIGVTEEHARIQVRALQ
jgi:hypothetical protein